MLKRSKIAGVAVILACIGARNGEAQIQFHVALGSLKYQGCTDVKKSDFSSVSLVTKANTPGLFEPLRFTVSKSGRIFFAERNGGVRVRETDGSIVKLGTVSIFPTTSTMSGNNELGLVGMQLDPAFERGVHPAQRDCRQHDHGGDAGHGQRDRLHPLGQPGDVEDFQGAADRRQSQRHVGGQQHPARLPALAAAGAPAQPSRFDGHPLFALCCAPRAAFYHATAVSGRGFAGI